MSYNCATFPCMKKPYIPSVGTSRRAIAERFLYLHKLRGDRGCSFCGENDPFVLEFDHKDGTVKVDHVTVMASAPHIYTAQQLLDEIAKCDILCANCHRRRTQKARKALERFAGVEYRDLAAHGDTLTEHGNLSKVSYAQKKYRESARQRKDASSYYLEGGRRKASSSKH